MTPDQRAAWNKLELIADTYLSVGTPVQVAAQRLLALRHDIQRRIRERLLTNLHRLRSAPHTELLRCEGGWYATLRVPRSVKWRCATPI